MAQTAIVKRPHRHSDEELQDISEHLHYEIQMLYGTAWMLAAFRVPTTLSPLEQHIVHNALLESFTIHVRNLLDFLYGPGSKPDDVLSDDFFDDPSLWPQKRPPKSSLLAEAHKRVGKEVAHSTYGRLKVTPETKPWSYLLIAREIGAVLQEFIKFVPTIRLNERVMKALKELQVPDLDVDQSAGGGEASRV